MGDMTRCPHDGFVGYCDICRPGWQAELDKAEKEDIIYQAGIAKGRKEAESARPEVGKLTDEQIMNAACTAADALDATRVSEIRAGGWHATTIFDGDSGLLRFGRLIEAAISARSPLARITSSSPQEPGK